VDLKAKFAVDIVRMKGGFRHIVINGEKMYSETAKDQLFFCYKDVNVSVNACPETSVR